MRRILITPWRRAAQVLAFLLAGPWLAVGVLQCPYGVPFVSCLSCPVTTCRGAWLFLPTLAALGLSQLLLARSFCAWLCPFGFIQDALAVWFGRRRAPRNPGRLDHVARLTKYGILLVVVVIAVVANYPDERAYDYVVRTPRWLDLEAARVAAALGLARYPVRWFLVAAGLLGSLVVARFWCRYLCPLGAALALARPLSLGSLQRDQTHCRTCTACAASCAMHTPPGSPECTGCYDCADRCPTRAVTTGWHWPWSRERQDAPTSAGAPQAVPSSGAECSSEQSATRQKGGPSRMG